MQRLAAISVSIVLSAAYLLHAADAKSAQYVTSQEVLDHLNRTISWYEHVIGAQQPTSAAEVMLLQENVRQSARQVVQKAFTFGRVQAAILATQKANATTAVQASTLEQAAASASARINRIQSQIEDLNAQIAKAPRRQVATLTAQRDTLKATLQFAQTAQTGLKDILKFASSPDKSGGLLGQINVLAASDSLPTALGTAPPPAPTTQNSTPFHPELAGIVPLIANTFELWRTRSQIDALIEDTDNLREETRKTAAPLRTQMRTLLNQGDALSVLAANETDPAKLVAAQGQVATIASTFKSLSAPMSPLSEQGIAIQTTRGNLEELRDSIGEQMQRVLRYLLLRLGGLLAAVFILLLISEIVRRATFRYVRDTRRRRQFVLIRRILVGMITAFIVVITSVSGIGSFATIAGFVTAGLAVALQNVILSVVAYFFLIGRYGLRTGDRVTVSGVNGQVLEVGLVRMYLMELAGSGTDLHSTGRVAVFSNSVIFQPSALIKQAPGTEYAWHSLTMTLSPEAGLEAGRKRIGAAVQKVYDTFKDSIHKQQEAFERAANIQVPEAAPVSRARFSENGIEVIVRYPVIIDNMWNIDQQILDAVTAEIDKEPALKLASNGYPKISAGS
jgi:small-conductance mechanosensitive channel